jgi:hypothetical protein
MVDKAIADEALDIFDDCLSVVENGG